jgi:hypothetical protein
MTKNEEKFRESLKDRLEKSLRSLLKHENLKIESQAKILYDITFASKNKEYRPQLGFLQQDIAIYSRQNMPKTISQYFYNSDSKEFIRIPRLIIETKYQVNSHALLTYSKIAEKIKSAFPFSRYYLVICHTSKEPNLLLRHGTIFDRIIKFEGEILKQTSFKPKAFFEKKNNKAKYKVLVTLIKLDLEYDKCEKE